MFSLFLLLCFTPYFVFAHHYDIKLTGDGPVVKGGTLNLKAAVYEGSTLASGQFKYYWMDNGIPKHEKYVPKTDSATDYWSILYNATVYPQGPYEVQVTVENCVIVVYCYEIGSNRYTFDLTESLNGELQLVQRNITRENAFVSNTDPVVHKIHLKDSDAEYVKTAPTVLTYWFVDCVYYGITNDFQFAFNYTKPEVYHSVEALVVADFTPLPPTTTVAPTTTTVKPTSTTKPTPTTTKALTTTTTSKPPATLTTTVKIIRSEKPSSSSGKNLIVKRSLGDNSTTTSKIMVNVNGTLVPYNVSFPYICNGSRVAIDPKKTYGYFYKQVFVKEPVKKVNVTGNNWLQHGDLLSLNVHCQGSKPMQYCLYYHNGVVNVTGNETCERYSTLNECAFVIQRYFAESAQHTIVIIVKNDVSKVVTPVTVTIYKAKVQAQLSVVVVPVAFSVVAVVIIVFGVAYYFQNRSRFVVEVADFNFGQQYSDMEYKTFRERLKDSITNAFTRGPSPSSSEVPVWPPGRKYGSMT